MANMLIAHGGAPTAVINASLYGAVMEAKKNPDIQHIYGAIHGSAGILNEEFIDLAAVGQEELDNLLFTPGSAIGTSRTDLQPEHYRRMAEVLKKYDIKYVLFNGGNGSMNTCGKLREACSEYEIFVAGIPKTIDNDVCVIDHAPGYGSAASFIANTVAEIAQDVKSLPIHVCIIETMGRNTGWITAAAALARKNKGDAPHLIYTPEGDFDEEEFLSDVKRLHEEKGGVVVVVSEGLSDKNGKFVAPPIFEKDGNIYYGPIGSYLAGLVIEKLGIKARSETPGILGRASSSTQSILDRDEAVRMGEMAAEAVLAGKSGVMAGLMRVSTNPYVCEEVLVPIEEVMKKERLMPLSYISEKGNDITDEFCDWCRPLIGDAIPDFTNFIVERKRTL